jgi:hypothetical protein
MPLRLAMVTVDKGESMRTQRGNAACLRASQTTPKPFAGFRAFFRTVAAIGFFMVAVPLHALADSCEPLLQDFVTYLQQQPGAFVQFVHTTNYQANNWWMGGHSWGFLQPATSGLILSGEVNRIWADDRTETFAIEFYADGSVRFAGQYGPYPTTCYGNKFLTVNTGDSFETFTFTKGALL